MNTAFVKIWGELVGAVAWDESRGYATFEYDPAFAARGWELSPLMMPVSPFSARAIQSGSLGREMRARRAYRATKTRFSFPALRKKTDPTLDTFKGLPGLLADALPDRYGNELIYLWLARQGRPLDSLNPVEMLCFIGNRAIGALEFEPALLSESKDAFNIEVDSLVEIARTLLSNKKSFSTQLLADEKKAIGDLLRIGTSAGGARPKAVIAYNEQTDEVRSGQTIAPAGFEHWLIKLDGVSDVQLGATKGYGRVEMAYYHMAIACGIEMMESRLLEENGRAHFMTKRFDREGAQTKYHIQSFCAIKHFDYNLVTSFSYEQLFQTMRELKLPYDAAEQMYRRMVFNVLARNCDDHTKNFAFRLKQDGDWELAPAYDLCHAYKPGHQWVSQHALSIQGKRDQLTKEDLLAVGSFLKSDKALEIIDQIGTVISQWNHYADDVQVDPELRDKIGATLIRWS